MSRLPSLRNECPSCRRTASPVSSSDPLLDRSLTWKSSTLAMT